MKTIAVINWLLYQLVVLLLAGLGRNKEKNLDFSLKFSWTALIHFQSQTVQRLCLTFVWIPSVNRVKHSVFVIHFPSIVRFVLNV